MRNALVRGRRVGFQCDHRVREGRRYLAELADVQADLELAEVDALQRDRLGGHGQVLPFAVVSDRLELLRQLHQVGVQFT